MSPRVRSPSQNKHVYFLPKMIFPSAFSKVTSPLPQTPSSWIFISNHLLENIKQWKRISKLEFELHSTMVGNLFETFMSEMARNVVNCQNSRLPCQAEIRKFKFLPKTLFPQAIWKIILISPHNLGEKWHYGHNSSLAAKNSL